MDLVLGDVLMRQRRYDEAHRVFLDALKRLGPHGGVDILTLCLEALVEGGRWAEALELCQTIENLDGPRMDLRVIRAYLFGMLQRAGGEDALRLAVFDDPALTTAALPAALRIRGRVLRDMLFLTPASELLARGVVHP